MIFLKTMEIGKCRPGQQNASILRRLERVFRCCSVCETMEDYNEGYLMEWANIYISYHDNAQGPQKRPLNFSFCKLSEKLIR